MSPNDRTDPLARKKQEFQLLQDVSARINATLQLEQIYAIALETLADLFGFEHALLFLLDASGEKLVVVASRGYEGHELGGEVPVGTGVPGMVAKKRRFLHMDNVGRQRSYLAAQRRSMVESGRSPEIGASFRVPELDGVQSQIAIPLLANDELIGVVSVESRKPRRFTEDDQVLIAIVANQTASAIRSARLHAELMQTNRELEERVRARTAELETKLQLAEEFLQDANRRVEGPLLGDSPAIVDLRAAIARCAANDDAVLIVGPHGAGKEATARAIHAQSKRARGAFVHVHCPQLTSEDATRLFGSALQPQSDGAAKSKFDLAHGGTLYLEGMEELEIELQVHVGKALQRLDAQRQSGVPFEPDVRVLVGARRDLRVEVQEARFDLELHRRLLRQQIIVPSLRERPEDIPVLAEHFVRRHALELGKDVASIAQPSMRLLQGYRWPGNVRELRHVIERAVVLSRGATLEIDEESLNEGIVFGTYRLVKQIASGGMGEVWLGRHALLARPAAVKLIRTTGIDGQKERELKARFRREAQVTADLRSPHTVQLYDFGISDTGTFYYVMELLSGMDLAAMVRRFGPLPAERVIMLLQQACTSLIEAHERGLVHRDIKPANLFVTALGPNYDFLKVLDFGTVKTTHEDTSEVTLQGAVAGTPAYMAPELVLGKSEIDARADLYSLGCSAYWMLTGQLVFEAENASGMFMHHVNTPPRAPSGVVETPVPRELDELVLRCLAKTREDRPASAAELRECLGRVACAADWTEERARSWWTLHAPDVLSGQATPREDTP